jgi:hypothetical protein
MIGIALMALMMGQPQVMQGSDGMYFCQYMQCNLMAGGGAPRVDDPYADLGKQSIDVPAIQESHEEEYGDTNWCNGCYNNVCTTMACDPHAKHKVSVTTCADKRRILLTSEDGRKHCITLENRNP